MMKRALIAAAWIGGSTIPVFVATVFIFGCCVLPFHGVIHRLMPLCQTAANIMSGGHHDDGAQTPAPARERQEPVKRLITEAPAAAAFAWPSNESRPTIARAPARDRNFISLGATRCDQDVGWHVVIETFLI